MTIRRTFLGSARLVGAALAACGPFLGGTADKISREKPARPVTLRWSTWGDDHLSCRW